MSLGTLHRIDVTNETHRMGFQALAAGMAAVCADEVHADITLLGGSSRPCSVVSELGLGFTVPEPDKREPHEEASFPMNTATASAPDISGLFARKVSEITGLSERELESYHPLGFGSPGHYRYISNVGCGVLYTPKGLLALLEGLRLAGRHAEAQSLADAIRAGGLEVKAPSATPITELPAKSHAEPPRSRLLDWEFRQGEDA